MLIRSLSTCLHAVAKSNSGQDISQVSAMSPFLIKIQYEAVDCLGLQNIMKENYLKKKRESERRFEEWYCGINKSMIIYLSDFSPKKGQKKE